MFPRNACFRLSLLALAVCPAGTQTTWLINNTTNIRGPPATKLGNTQVISAPYNNAVQFNGINDGLIVSNKDAIEPEERPGILCCPD